MTFFSKKNLPDQKVISGRLNKVLFILIKLVNYDFYQKIPEQELRY